MADQNITFKITVNSKQAEDAFRKLADAQGATITQTNKMGNSSKGLITAWRSQNQLGNQFIGVVRSGTMFTNGFTSGLQGLTLGLESLSDVYEVAKIRGLAFSTVLKQSMSGLSGLAVVVTLAVTAYSIFQKEQEKAKKKTDDLAESLKVLKGAFDNLLKIENPFEKLFFPLKSGEIGRLLDNVTNQLITSQQNISLMVQNFIRSKPVGQIWTTDPDKIIEMMKKAGKLDEAKNLQLLIKQKGAREELVKTLEEQKLKVESMETAYKALTDAGLKVETKIEGVTKAIKEQSKSVGFLSVLYSSMLSTFERMAKTSPMGKPTGQGLQPSGLVPTPDKPIPNTFVSEAQLKEYDAFLYTTMTATAQSIGGLFKGMWREIFGEANNLLTDFIGNIVSALADLAARQLAMSLLNFVFPGAGTAANIALGSQVSSGTPSAKGDLQKSTNVYNINIGDQKVAQVVTEGYNTAVRLRKL